MRFSLIDRIVELEPCVRITAVKTLTMAEEYLADHFPHFPVMPGVLMLEALTQAGAWLVRVSEDFAHSIVVLKQANNVKYAQFVEPGQTLTVTAEILKFDDGEVKLKAYGTVGGRIIVSARLTLACYNLADADPQHEATDAAIAARTCGTSWRCSTSRRWNIPRGNRQPADSRSSTMRFEGKTAIVTGGSRGIGRACVGPLGRRRRQGGLRLPQQPAGRRGAGGRVEVGRRARSAPCRPTSAISQRAHQIVDQLFEEWGQIDVLVNSAGIVHDGLLGAMTAEQWRDVIDTNLGGTFNYCHAVTQPMMMMRRGSIVNLSSTAAEFAARGQVNYAASKGGINGLTRALAKELAPRNVRVNAVAPGMIETDMSQVVRGIAGDQIKKMIPLKRIGQPEEVAAVVAFLASDDAAYLTGQVLRVDGGLSLGGY